MRVSADTLDDLLQRTYPRLLRSRLRTFPTNGEAKEIIAVTLNLRNPRARFSRSQRRSTLFSCLGETLWYFAGSSSLNHIEHYIETYRSKLKLPKDAAETPGGYGPRLFGGGKDCQIEKIISLILRKPDTRQACVQVYSENDLDSGDVPCTMNLQFLPRGGRLHMFTTMRSNDAYIGLPHDIFAFTMIQEYVARATTLELGQYYHSVGSLHLYEKDYKKVSDYIEEGWQRRVEMPTMPLGDPRPSVARVLGAEEEIRLGKPLTPFQDLDDYWSDIIRLLLIWSSLKARSYKAIIPYKNAMTCDAYESIIRHKSGDSIGRMTLPLFSVATSGVKKK